MDNKYNGFKEGVEGCRAKMEKVRLGRMEWLKLGNSPDEIDFGEMHILHVPKDKE